MKKIFVTASLAFLSFGLFAALTENGNTYSHEDYATMSSQPFQDTSTQKKNKKGKKDKNKKDTMFVTTSPVATQLVAK